MSCPTPKKRAYDTPQQATAAMRDAISRGVDSGRYVAVYRCGGCARYHWGHSGKLWRKAIENTIRAGNSKAAAARRPARGRR